MRRAAGEGAAATVLDRAFSGRDRLALGSYDPAFAAGWTRVGEVLEAEQKSSGLWDLASEKRARRVQWLGLLVGLVGVAIALAGAALAGGSVAVPLLLAAVGGVLAGIGAAAFLRGWELRVLTPEGSAAWLQVESLRQYLAGSPQAAIDTAVATGQVGRYTAWAMALGEADRWAELARTAAGPGRAPARPVPLLRGLRPGVPDRLRPHQRGPVVLVVRVLVREQRQRRRRFRRRRRRLLVSRRAGQRRCSPKKARIRAQASSDSGSE